MAVFIDSLVPTHSSTASAPTPSVSSRTRRDGLVAAHLDDVGGAELAGDLLARRVARHGDDPLGAHPRGGEDAAQADGAVADDHDGVALAARRRRPPRASRCPSRRRALSRRGDERRRPAPRGWPRGCRRPAGRGRTRPGRRRPWRRRGPGRPRSRRASQRDWMPTRQCGQVLSEYMNGAMTKSPGRTAADLARRPPRRCRRTRGRCGVGSVTALIAAVGPQVAAADARGGDPHQGVGRARGSGSARRLEADVERGVDDRGLHWGQPLCW